MSDASPLRIVRGEPTAEEVAVVAALMAVAGDTEVVAPPAPQRGRWNDPSRQVRRPVSPGPGAWRSWLR